MATATRLLGMDLTNPVVVGSGLLTDQERNIRRLLHSGAGAVVTKTIHPNPPTGLDERIIRLPTGMINSTTYSKRSVDHWVGILHDLARDRLPVIASLHADSPAELAELAARVEAAGCRALELGISCLNEEDGLDDAPERVHAYTAAARAATRLPFSVKLASGEGLHARALAAARAGADAVTISDTLPAAAVHPETGDLRLGGVFGYSGPGIKPLVLASLWKLRSAGFPLPLMGSGGVQSGRDVHDYLGVGAVAVQVYTALHTDMILTLTRIVAEATGSGNADHSCEPVVGVDRSGQVRS
ncbi:dihydroorotate dehydrogenase [Streptomyces noursei]|uniref:dihydroorotate dehydrogenase n=1 Tax=Streptomyces noursei TaxID=1971 RepID=UPI00167A3122|nr:dihydroorotate dehydrogenase [Streptomyces noursei]MCZ1020868.1 dihydroorotate dehydrogenase [Streptomyces noursei]GGX44244.1 dihydroorotate dehydrogenase [Streptomyces noursei]